MATTKDLQSSDLKQLNALLRNKDRSTRNQNNLYDDNFGITPKQSGLQSQAAENTRRRQQRAGRRNNDIDMEDIKDNVTDVVENITDTVTQTLTQLTGQSAEPVEKRRFSRKDAIEAVSETTGDTRQNVRDTIDNLFGERNTRLNQDQLSEVAKIHADAMKRSASRPNRYTRNMVVDAVADATRNGKSKVDKTITHVYGNKQDFNDQELANITDIQTALNNQKDQLDEDSFTYNRETLIDAVADATGDTFENVAKTIDKVYGNREEFDDNDVTDAVTIHMDQKAKRNQRAGRRMIKPQKSYTSDEVRSLIAQRLGVGTDEIEMLNEDQEYTDRDVEKIIMNLENQGYGQQGMESRRSNNGNQYGGNSMPWVWYNPTTPVNTVAASIDQPYMIGGANGNDSFDEISDAIDKNVGLHQALGSNELVITPENKEKLFSYLYEVYPQLKENNQTANIFEDADNDDAYIWSEYQDIELPNVVSYIIQQTLNYYQNTYPNDSQGYDQLEDIFTQS